MNRAEAVAQIAAIDYWGSRDLGASRATAGRIVDHLLAVGVLLLDEGDVA